MRARLLSKRLESTRRRRSAGQRKVCKNLPYLACMAGTLWSTGLSALLCRMAHGGHALELSALLYHIGLEWDAPVPS